jgi:hypothetical protein
MSGPATSDCSLIGCKQQTSVWCQIGAGNPLDAGCILEGQQRRHIKTALADAGTIPGDVFGEQFPNLVVVDI